MFHDEDVVRFGEGVAIALVVLLCVVLGTGCSVPITKVEQESACIYAGCDVMFEGQTTLIHPNRMSLSDCNKAYEGMVQKINNSAFDPAFLINPRFLGYCVGGLDYQNDEVNR